VLVVSLLQQPTRKACISIQGDQRRHRHSCYHLQYPAALGDRHVGRHHEAAVRAEEHPGVKDATASMVRVSQQRRMARSSTAIGRGCDRARLYGAWPRLHFGDVECRAAAVRGIHAAWQKGDVPRAESARQADAAAHQLFIESNPRRSNMRCRCSASWRRSCVCRWCGVEPTRAASAAPWFTPPDH